MMAHNMRNTERYTSRYTTDKDLVIHPHARKHGLTDEQICHAYATGRHKAIVRWTDRNSDPLRWATIGFDAQLRQIELLYAHLRNGQTLVFHANYATKTFRRQLRRGWNNG